MPVFSPTQLAVWSRGRWTAPPAAPVTGFSHDTRTLQPGQLFVALKTGRRDGHGFLLAAQMAGAAGAVVSRIDRALTLPQLVVEDSLAAFQTIAGHHRQTFRGPVIGISGSVGKTSTKDLLARLLGGAGQGAGGGPVLATEGNLNNHLGVPLTLMRLDSGWHKFAVIEAGVSAPGEMAPLAHMIEPDLALVTLVAPAHLLGFRDLKGVAREKAALLAAVRPAGLALFPRPCAQFPAFRSLRCRTLVVEPGAGAAPGAASSDTLVFAVSSPGDDTFLTLFAGSEPPLTFKLRRVSAGMAQNAVLALCAARHLGVPPATLQERLATWQPARWRGELRRKDGRLVYLDCYNASPVSMADALDHFAAVAPPGLPRAYVLGCMEELGPRAADFHQELGRQLRLRPQDRLFVIGDHAAALCEGLRAAGYATGLVEIVDDLAPVAAFLAGFRGAVFLKGSRRYQLEKALPGSAPEESAPC